MAVRPDGPHPARKGVDRRRDAVYRVRGHIAHPVRLGEDTRQHTQQVVHLIGARVVGAHQRVRGVQAAVQELGLRVLGRHLQTGRPHPDAGGEHHIRVVVGHFFQDLFRIHLRGHIFPVGDDEPIAKFRLEGLNALLVAAHPGARFGVVFVQEDHLELAGLLAKDVQLAQQRLAGGVRLQRERYRVRLGQDLDLIPQLGEVLPHLRRGGLAGIRIAVDRKIDQQGVARRQIQRRTAQRIELLAEHGVERRKIQPVVVRPGFARRLADQSLQFCIAAQFGEAHVVHLGQLVKIEKFVVDLIFQRIVPGRDEPGHGAGDGDSLIIFEDGHPLVALLHIEPVQVFVGDDGGMDALFQMGIAEVRPLGGELGVIIQQGHEVGGKRRVAAAGLGAHDALGRDVHQPQRLLRHDVHTVQDLIQDFQIRRLPPRDAGTVCTLARTQRISVIFYHSKTPSREMKGFFHSLEHTRLQA